MIKLGIIGVGNIGTTHTNIILDGKAPEIELVAVADHIVSRCDWVKEKLPGVKVFADGEEMINSGVCEAIIVATPHYQHPELTIKALNKGLHVLCEKPAGVYTKQAREMNEVALKSGLTFGMVFQQRADSINRKMKEIISSGELGAIKRVNLIITDWYRSQYYYDSGDWRATWEGEGGGVLLNQCPHNLDILQWICGMPNKIHAFCHVGKWHDIEVEDDVTAYLEYPNGATGVVVTTTGDTPGDNRFAITLEKGMLICDKGNLIMHKLEQNEREFCVTVKDSFAQPECETILLDDKRQYPQHSDVINAFAANILRGEPLIAPGIEGINSLTISNAMYLSTWLGKAIDIPFDEDLFLEELNKRRATSKRKPKSNVAPQAAY